MLLYRKVTSDVDTVNSPPTEFAAQFEAEANKLLSQLLEAKKKALQLKLKIFHNGILELVETQKDKTYAELLQECR